MIQSMVSISVENSGTFTLLGVYMLVSVVKTFAGTEIPCWNSIGEVYSITSAVSFLRFKVKLQSSRNFNVALLESDLTDKAKKTI